MKKMKLFQENNCRLCKKVFCCIKCRKKHEITHEIYPECNICVYGEMILMVPLTLNLMNHLHEKHWPLRCKLCLEEFISTDKLAQGGKCPILSNINQEMFKSPLVKYQNCYDYESPPHIVNLNANNLTPNYMSELNLYVQATSTPLMIQNFTRFSDNLSQISTEETENYKCTTHGPTTIEEIVLSGTSSNEKRKKVTFNKTPLPKQNKTSEELKDLKSSLKKPKITEEHTVNSNVAKKLEIQTESPQVDKTLWVTATDMVNAFPIIKVENETLVSGQQNHENDNYESHHPNMWNTMFSYIKSIVDSLSEVTTRKRKRTETEIEYLLQGKRRKLVECRPPINEKYRFIRTCNKYTQTDF